MSLQLSQEDQRAVDLLLDRVATVKGDGNGGGHDQPVYVATDPSLAERTSRVQKLLRLLDAMPAPDAPGDLVARTMDFVERSVARQPVAPDLQALLSSQGPVA
jgi:hypothetical protein